MTLEKDLERGMRAERLLKDDLLAEAFDSVRTAIFERIESTPVRDTDGLTQLRLMLKLLKDLRANLEQAIRDGKLASEALKMEKEPKLRVFR